MRNKNIYKLFLTLTIFFFFSNLTFADKFVFEVEEIEVTENGNIILDCDFGVIKSPKILQQKMINIPGVIEAGIFTRKPDIIYKAKANGKFEILT